VVRALIYKVRRIEHRGSSDSRPGHQSQSSIDPTNHTNSSPKLKLKYFPRPPTARTRTCAIPNSPKILPQGAKLANPDVRNWDVSNVKWLKKMFKDAVSANPDISLWFRDAKFNGWDWSYMFQGAEAAGERFEN
jgi:hypothetical protein